MSANVFGILAALIILASFVLRGEKKIRLVNLVGCVFLVLYGVKHEPVDLILIFLGAIAVLIHCAQFWAMWKEAKSAKAVAKAEARAAEAENKMKLTEEKKIKQDDTL